MTTIKGTDALYCTETYCMLLYNTRNGDNFTKIAFSIGDLCKTDPNPPLYVEN